MYSFSSNSVQDRVPVWDTQTGNALKGEAGTSGNTPSVDTASILKVAVSDPQPSDGSTNITIADLSKSAEFVGGQYYLRGEFDSEHAGLGMPMRQKKAKAPEKARGCRIGKILRPWRLLSPKSHSATFVNAVSDFSCHQGSYPNGTLPLVQRLGDLYSVWDGKACVLHPQGNPLGLMRSKTGPHAGWLSDSTIKKSSRTEGVLNELLSLGREMPAHIDMQDARYYGLPENGYPPASTITYNRRHGARGVVLWPLPGYHTLGQERYVHRQPLDDRPFKSKGDIVVWRGNLAGASGYHLPRDHSDHGNVAHAILRRFGDLDVSRAPRLLKRLAGITRFEVVKKFRNHPDFDVGLTIPDHHKSKPLEAALGDLTEPRQRTEWFYRFKYILSLSGIDTGSNFLMAANSRSVVFKEEDGWELFYTGLFKPWEHYVPLDRGAGDVEEKLEWARKNENACIEMSAASREVCRLLASPVNRNGYLNQISEFYSGLKLSTAA